MSEAADRPIPAPVSRPQTRSPHGAGNRAARIAWGVAYTLLFRPSPRPMHRWRNWLLRRFGAKLHPAARIYPRARIWAPWNLVMGEGATIADDVDVYAVDTITLGSRCVISQYCYLCGATHDFEQAERPLVALPITIGRDAWLAADVFVAPGTTIGDGTVVGARSSVFEDLEPWKICFGTPAKPVRDRVIRDGHDENHA